MVVRLKNIKFADNISQFDLWLVYNNISINIELYRKTMIKVNRRTFSSIMAINNYIEIYIFEENCLLFQVKIIENCKMKNTIRSTAYIKLVTKFFQNRFEKKSKWILEQFIKLIKLLLAIKPIIVNIKN